MKVLLSINPEYVEKIFNGTKKFEYRKTAFRRTDIKTAVIYCTAPVMQIVGEFEIVDIVTEHPKALWDRTHEHAGIGEAFFESYYAGRTEAIAIEIGKIKRYSEPVDPRTISVNFVAPQSFKYIAENELVVQ